MLDLADALTTETQPLTDISQRLLLPTQAVAAQDRSLTIVETAEKRTDSVDFTPIKNASRQLRERAALQSTRRTCRAHRPRRPCRDYFLRCSDATLTPACAIEPACTLRLIPNQFAIGVRDFARRASPGLLLTSPREHAT